MNRLRRSFRESFRRKKKDHIPESSKPHQWEEDEKAVRAGDCSFAVKYLGCVEVFDARGMQVCEEALKILRSSRRKAIKGVLHVTGDGLRVVDDDKRGLIVDQTIEKVSFCAPDRYHERGFSYICRDGATRRWMCHGFHAIKDSGERLSHAVGCAFAVCLEKKQKRDREHQNQIAATNQQACTSSTRTTSSTPFQRNSSFRQSSILERLKDPQVAKPVIEKPPAKSVVNPFAIERPHATPQLLERQGSFRGFSSLSSASPFKRQLSLRLNELPSNLERYNRSSSLAANKTGNINTNNNNNNNNNTFQSSYNNNSTSTQSTSSNCSISNLVNGNISNASSTLNNSPGTLENILNSNSFTNGNANDSNDMTSSSHFMSSISEMCKELTHGLTLLSNNDDANIDPLKWSYPDSTTSNSTTTTTTTTTSSTYIIPFRTAIGNTVKANNSNCNSNSLPTATVAPVMSPATLSTVSSGILQASIPPPLPPVKSPFALNQNRIMSSTLNSPISNGIHQFRRPVPPPPVSSGFSKSPNAHTFQSTHQENSSSIPKLASIRSQPFSKTIDLNNIFPARTDDPFDAEWTNVVTENLSQSKNPSVSSPNDKIHSSEAMKKVTLSNGPLNKLSPSKAEPSETTTNSLPSVTYDSGINSSSNVTSSPVTSTNPFTTTNTLPKLQEPSGFRKEFQIEM